VRAPAESDVARGSRFVKLPARLASYLVAGAIVAALLFYIFGRIDAYFSQQDQLITESSKAQLALHPALVRMRQKYLVVEQRASQAMTVQRTLGDSLRHLLATGQRVDTVEVLREIAIHDSSGLASCGLALRACQQRAQSAEAEADSLARRLTAQLRVRNHPCGVTMGLGVAAGSKAAWGGAILVGCQVVRSPWP